MLLIAMWQDFALLNRILIARLCLESESESESEENTKIIRLSNKRGFDSLNIMHACG